MRMVTSNMIKSLRKSRNLTQEQLGILSGMSKSQISKMENGTLGSEETVLRLLDALGYELELKVVDKYPGERSERERILGVLRSFKNSQGDKYGIERIALFGSCARGEQTVDSDVDILISIKKPSLYCLRYLCCWSQYLNEKWISYLKNREVVRSLWTILRKI